RMPGVAALIDRHGHAFVASEVRKLLADWRRAFVEHMPPPVSERDDAAIVRRIESSVSARAAPSLRPVFNLTGTVLHTNLGRALLCDAAAEEAARVARLPVNLEFDVASGERGDRDSLVEALICEITGAEAATVVNNNAAAVLLTIAAL